MNTQQQVDRKRSLNRQGVAEKMPTILVEIGENGSKDQDHVNAMINGLEESLSIIGLKGTELKEMLAKPSSQNIQYFDGTNSVPVAHSGLWFPKVVTGQFIKEGASLKIISAIHLKPFLRHTLDTHYMALMAPQ